MTPQTVVSLIVLVGLGAVVYRQWLINTHKETMDDRYRHIRRHLKSGDTDALINSSVPILWVHVPFELNDRVWASYMDRNSTNLNQPYLSLCVKSIVKFCDDDFKVCIIDDHSFAKLMPDWTLTLSHYSEPVRSKIRALGMAHLLREYGGLVVPISFLALRPLLPLYTSGLSKADMFSGECVCRDLNATKQVFCPSSDFLGAKRHSEAIQQYCMLLAKLAHDDHTEESNMCGEVSQWLQTHTHVISGTNLGTRSVMNEPVSLELLMGPSQVRPEMHPQMAGMWIPQRELLKRTAYDWFVHTPVNQLFRGEYWLSDLFVLALAPG